MKFDAYEETCTEPGLTDGMKCSRCEETLKEQEEVKALSHQEERPASGPATERTASAAQKSTLPKDCANPPQSTAPKTAS
ncbi:MAG: hypothetical protein HUJ55_01115 [Ileibacterium sp.]|nr:hypothetical protein [Ileibacterium sp.]